MEFNWNKIPKSDYLYFLDARIYSHTIAFVRFNIYGTAAKYGKGKKVDTYYSCLKENGDLNSVFTIARIANSSVVKICDSLAELESELFEQMRLEVLTGQLGENVFQVTVRSFGYQIHKSSLKVHPSKRKIIKALKGYRKGTLKSESNQRANNYYGNVIGQHPYLVRKPFGPKKRLFR